MRFLQFIHTHIYIYIYILIKLDGAISIPIINMEKNA